jgi:hypothetical protein
VLRRHFFHALAHRLNRLPSIIANNQSVPWQRAYRRRRQHGL